MCQANTGGKKEGTRVWGSPLVECGDVQMKGNKRSKENTKCAVPGEEGAPGSGMKLSPVSKKIKRPEKSLMLNGVKGVEPSGGELILLSFRKE